MAGYVPSMFLKYVIGNVAAVIDVFVLCMMCTHSFLLCNLIGTPVAVKVLNSACQQQLNEQGVSAFEDEVRMLARIRHPHICLFMGACMTPPSRAIVTELVRVPICMRSIVCVFG